MIARELKRVHRIEGFTLVELLVVIAITGILAALLFTALSGVNASGLRTTCISNVKQISHGVMMYAADNQDILFPFLKKPDHARSVYAFNEWTAYVPLIGGYVGWKGGPSPQDKVFACPADTFYSDLDSPHTFYRYWINQSLHSWSNVNYSSYFFNAGNAVFQGYDYRDEFPNTWPGVLGSRLGSIRTSSRTVLLGEEPAWEPYSWHSPSRPRRFRFNNALDVLGFADGHVRYVKMNKPSDPFSSLTFDPPSGYDYQWSGN